MRVLELESIPMLGIRPQRVLLKLEHTLQPKVGQRIGLLPLLGVGLKRNLIPLGCTLCSLLRRL